MMIKFTEAENGTNPIWINASKVKSVVPSHSGKNTVINFGPKEEVVVLGFAEETIAKLNEYYASIAMESAIFGGK